MQLGPYHSPITSGTCPVGPCNVLGSSSVKVRSGDRAWLPRVSGDVLRACQCAPSEGLPRVESERGESWHVTGV